MTIFHQSKTMDEVLGSQIALARQQYMPRHFATAHRPAGILALGLGYAIRSVVDRS